MSPGLLATQLLTLLVCFVLTQRVGGSVPPGPVGSVGGAVGSVGGAVGSVGGPVGSVGGPVGSVGGAVGVTWSG